LQVTGKLRGVAVSLTLPSQEFITAVAASRKSGSGLKRILKGVM
jgi:hypothetical protein